MLNPMTISDQKHDQNKLLFRLMIKYMIQSTVSMIKMNQDQINDSINLINIIKIQDQIHDQYLL